MRDFLMDQGTEMAFIPSYISLFEKGELSQRIQLLKEFLKECRLCPRECRVNRLDGEIGVLRSRVRTHGLECLSPFWRGTPSGWISRFRNHLPHPLQPSVHFLPKLRHQPSWEVGNASPPLIWHGSC